MRAKEFVAERESAHEHCEHDGLRVDGAAEHLGKKLRPDDLVDERGGAGTEEQSQHQPAAIAEFHARKLGGVRGGGKRKAPLHLGVHG